ncbi:lipid II-degrading bacteriocin [Salmonella enterica]|nr:lipid II-degrading bacteriocin [Salmonella enterica]EEU3909621.1 lipid II-degrading bacteriocin [Salmonella enterica]EGY4580826.1 lipid II-degrading bacteriocin [Salmonella enterica]EGY4585994.1 lipid II-degrading bacteriocin [Salmonella enterica]EGY9843155.1 lipid II-degrading bacteriocin [Salmonella enterica]
MDTLVVTAPSPSTNLPSYGNGAFSLSVPHSPGAGPLMVQTVYSYFQSPSICLQALTQLEDYIKKHGASDPLTLQIIATNVGYFCNADRNLMLHPGLSVYDAYHLSNPAPNKYDYRSMNMQQMSGNVTTPVVAFAHYLWGDGADRSVNIANIGLKISPIQIEQIRSIVNSGVVGTFPISTNFTHATGDYNTITGAYLGNITLKTEGTLTVSSNGSWVYNGVVRSYNDKYDFNASTHRGVIGESLTRLGEMFSGKEYKILLPGEVPVKGSGKR